MELLHKSFALSVKSTDDAARTLQGYAATYNNVDEQGDMILPGAFAESIAKRMPIKMLCQHDTDCAIGLWTKAIDDATGLLLDGFIVDTDEGMDTYKLLKAGVLDSLSIGYTVDDAELTAIAGNTVRVLKKLTLWEASIVTFPANTQAKITGVKTAHDNEREFESFLREAGYSRDAAKIITARGFKALNADQREADEAKVRREAEAKALAELSPLLTQFTKELSLCPK